MTDFVQTLELKIQQLQDAKADHLDAIADIDGKVVLLEELLSGETGAPVVPPSTKKRRPGRPKGTKNKKKAAEAQADNRVPEEELQEAQGMEGTDPELAKRLATRRPVPVARPPAASWGPGVTAGRPEDVEKGRSTVTGVGKKQLITRETEEEVDDGGVQGEQEPS